MKIEQAGEYIGQIRHELGKVICGQDEVLKQMVVVLLAGGHGILEGVPGTAKTLMVRAFAKITGVEFRRIQFTPDLMPSDILGVNIYDTASSQFVFRPGPIFSDFILADEINRTPAKTQAALLESMQERRATIDGVGHELSPNFTVFATMNPIEFEGTYPLPEAQVDRFMLKIVVDYPSEEMEAAILDRPLVNLDVAGLSTDQAQPILNSDSLSQLRATIQEVAVEKIVLRYITTIVRSTRTMSEVSLGASPRTAVMLLAAARAMAVIEGRTFATPDDVKAVAIPLLRHRMVLLPEVEIEGRKVDDCIIKMLDSIPVPR